MLITRFSCTLQSGKRMIMYFDQPKRIVTVDDSEKWEKILREKIDAKIRENLTNWRYEFNLPDPTLGIPF